MGRVVRFRYRDLKEADRGCGGRGSYANSIVHTRAGINTPWTTKRNVDIHARESFSRASAAGGLSTLTRLRSASCPDPFQR